MRSISADLLAKIKKSQQTIYQNANPALKVLLSKGFRKDLFRVYTIHNDELLEGLDVAVRRMDTLFKPNKVFVVYIKDGVAHVKSKDLPYDETLPWDYEFEIGAASEVAIEFDGYWEREATSSRFNLITDEYPYIFKVNSDTLSAQFWNGTPITLATNVSKISAIRGWVPVNGDATNDQGLIIAYIKIDGTVWYRTYSIQIGGAKSWESELQMTEFTKTAVDISTFRTNDFRVGFVVQNSDNTVELLVTTRNWAGMSFPAETVSLDVAFESALFEVFEITTHLIDVYPQEVVKITELDAGAIFNIYEDGETPVAYTVLATDGYITGDRTFTVEFNYPIYSWKPEKLIEMVASLNIVSAIVDGNKLRFTTDTDFTEIESIQGFNVTLGGGLIVGQIDSNRQEFYAGSSFAIRGVIPPHTETVSLDVGLAEATFDIFEITTHSYTAYPQEIISLDVAFEEATFTITEVSTNPI